MTRLLLDTHLLLWICEGAPRLPKQVILEIEDMRNDVLFSAASIWEIAIKASRRQDFNIAAAVLHDQLLDNGYVELPVTGKHAAIVETLPSFHWDPFDRIMIAQALCEGLTFLTADKTVARYGGLITLV